VSNQTSNQIQPPVKPDRAMEKGQQSAATPEVPITADLPVVPEFRDNSGVVQAIDWRAALSAASLAAFLAAVAGIGCVTRSAIRKPSPATPMSGPSAITDARAGRNFGLPKS